MDEWLFLQLADSAFPTGGFAHSLGLEAALHLGRVELAAFARQALWQTGLASLPFANTAHDAPERLPEIDQVCDAFTSSHVANAASRTQGRALVATAARIFDDAPIAAIYGDLKRASIFGHLAPMLGAVTRALGVDKRGMQRLALHGSVRQVTSAGVRLGMVGPHEAQRIQRELAPEMDRVLARCAFSGMDDAAQPAPILDTFGALHDKLYARLFQS